MACKPHKHGLSTLVNHMKEGHNPHGAHVTPIYQTSTFDFEDVAQGAAAFKGESDGYIYTRINNPNTDQIAGKIACLEGVDLLRAQPEKALEDVVGGHVFSSGMAAITSAILACVKPGQTIIAQDSLYGATYGFLKSYAPQWGLNVVFVHSPTPEEWEKAFAAHPDAVLAYAESPANPTMTLVDLKASAEIIHRHNAWLMVDNTFATPYAQRPLTLGADVVIHSTTKYLSGHGLVVGGAVVSNHVDWVRTKLHAMLKTMGGNAAPFEAWLTNIGLRTFELRMQRHCENGMEVAEYLEKHPAISQVYYPGLKSNPQHELATRQMSASGCPCYGGMIAFELKGGLDAGVRMMERVKLCSLAVSLGDVDSLIQHPASMTHSGISAEDRRAIGLSDGLVRLSVGIENAGDIIEDLEQSLS